MSRLIYVDDGRHVAEDDVAEDAAHATFGELVTGARNADLLDRVDYYAEGHAVSPTLWAESCRRYAALIEAHWSDTGNLFRGTEDYPELVAELNEIRAWVMPARPDVAVAAE